VDNGNVTMTIIVKPRKSESLTILFKEGASLGNSTTYELDLVKLKLMGVGLVMFK
jgi:hypothetical protein